MLTPFSAETAAGGFDGVGVGGGCGCRGRGGTRFCYGSDSQHQF